jgi:hypothetical protein
LGVILASNSRSSAVRRPLSFFLSLPLSLSIGVQPLIFRAPTLANFRAPTLANFCPVGTRTCVLRIKVKLMSAGHH